MKEYKLCTNCGSQNELFAKFCLNCGFNTFSEVKTEETEVHFLEDEIEEVNLEVEVDGATTLLGVEQKAEEFGPRKFDVLPYYVEESPALVYPRIKFKTDLLMGEYPSIIEDDEELLVTLSQIKSKNSKGFIEYKGKQYASVIAKEKNYRGTKFSNGEEIVPGKTYFFRVEPIEWKVILGTQSKELIITKNIIDYEVFNEYGNFDGKFANTYLTSHIRKWLNGYFIETSFSQDEKKKISPTIIRKKNGEKIFDNVFLLGYTDILNTDLGLNLVDDRRTQMTDYAKIKGGYFLEDGSLPNNGVWALRSPKGTKGTLISCVDIDGSICKCTYDSLSCCGIRPTITLK